MLRTIDKYFTLRRNLGFKLKDSERHIKAYLEFAKNKGVTTVHKETAILWATASSTPLQRRIKFRDLALFSRFAHLEDSRNELLSSSPFSYTHPRRVPYIYSADEIGRIVQAAQALEKKPTYPMKPLVYSTIIGLIAATGLRISEALSLRLSDLTRDGVIHVRNSKFRKSRLIPLHPTVNTAMAKYLKVRLQIPSESDLIFLSAHGKKLLPGTVEEAFRELLRRTGIEGRGGRRPRIHDCHSFATHALEQCSTKKEMIARNFLAVSTYLRHVDTESTYWYFEKTPQLTPIFAPGYPTSSSFYLDSIRITSAS